MKHISLFSGIGGFDYASELMGWENISHCEINEFCLKILKYYWPNAKTHTDIKSTDFTVYRGFCDILTGGFPCQPYSQAGQRKGKEDERHLWPEMLRAIREIAPRWVVGENVRGLINWSDGLVFHEVQADLEAEGYEVFPFLLPAAGIDAPHERYRIWFVAHAIGNVYSRKERGGYDETERMASVYRKENCSAGKSCGANFNDTKRDEQKQYDFADTESKRQKQPGISREWRPGFANSCSDGVITDPHGVQRSKGGVYADRSGQTERHFGSRDSWDSRRSWEKFPTQSPVCDGDDGLSTRLDGITFSKWRNESIKGGGNAIVPQVALQIFKAVYEYERVTA